MTPSSDDVHHMMHEISARCHPKRGRKSRGLRQHECRAKAKRLQYNAIHPSSFGEIDQRISSSCTFIRNESPPNNVVSGDSSKPSFSLYLQHFLSQETHQFPVTFHTCMDFSPQNVQYKSASRPEEESKREYHSASASPGLMLFDAQSEMSLPLTGPRMPVD
ncbi:unnamed protein product [Protopolystoma xenopodis]|uniref:Uncharacterized protein n=1 Tax=Protopolystoma xenopodis TaxID=117903 RepID=A0A448WWL1_9PLAT|nr:unnamed protein product [Protopolystoma xenopodis]